MTTSTATATVEPYRLANFAGKHIRYATRVTIAGVVVDFDGKLSKAAAIRQAEEHIAREAGHQAAWAGRGNFPLADPAVAAIVEGAKVGEKTHVLEAFARSWDRANLAKPVPAPAPERIPTVWGEDCRYCERYRRPCGRHEDLTMRQDDTPATLF